MSWDSKTDYCGLAVANKLVIKGSNMNRSGQYLRKAGRSGAICATKPFGVTDAPSCEYTIKKAHSFADGDIKLGQVTTVDGKRYALESFTYSTGADEEPTFSGVAKEIEATTDGTDRMFDVPAFDISPEEEAEIQMSAATVSGSGCEVTKSVLTGASSVKPHTVNGVPVASDVTMGYLEVALTILQSSSTDPTVTPGTGWDLSAPLTCNDPDADYPEWTCTLSKPLSYHVAQANS